MKLSKLRQIVKEEIAKTITEGDFETAMDNLNSKVGIKPTTAKNTFKEPEYTVQYWYLHNDEKDNDVIKVKAKDEAEALKKAAEELKKSELRYIRNAFGLKVIK